jgi:hypothetical protein
MGITVLAIFYVVVGIALILGGPLSSDFNPYVSIPTGVVLAVLSVGIWTLQRWARMGALILAIINVVGSVGFIIYLMLDNSNAVLPAALWLMVPVFINVRIFMYLTKLEVEQAFGLYDDDQTSLGSPGPQ